MMESLDFNDFIDGMEILDIPLIGRKYTWMRPNGQQMSRLDRTMVSSEWLIDWPGYSRSITKGNLRSLPILVQKDKSELGP